MNRLKKILATVLSVMLVLTSITLPALANEDLSIEYVSVTEDATTHKASATATASTYETDPNNTLVDGNTTNYYGTGPANGAYFTFIDLGEGGKRVDKVVITADDPYDRTVGQVYYLANTLPISGADRTGWVELGTRTVDGETMTFILTSELAGVYRYVVADCTGSTVGGYVNEIEVYKDASYVEDSGDEAVEAANVALGKPVSTSRASAGIAGYTDTAVITDGTFFANNSNNQYITYGPSLICIDLESRYSVSKLVIDALLPNFTKNIDVYVSDAASAGDSVPSGATKVLAGDANGWAEGVKTVELDTAVDGRYVILFMTSNASPSFRLSEVEVWGVPAADDGGEEDGEGGEESGDGEEASTGYVSVTDSATSHKSSATATATNYETDANNYLVDGNPSTQYGTGPANGAYFTFIDLGVGGRRVDKVVITSNDIFGPDRVKGQKYYLANTVPVSGADRTDWVYLGQRTENGTAMTFVLEPEQAGVYRYVVADCTGDTVGGYVNEIEVYMDINAYLTELGKTYTLTDKTSSVSMAAISYSGTLISGEDSLTIVGLFGTRGADGEYIETAYDQAAATGTGAHNIDMYAAVSNDGKWDAIFLSGLKFVKGFSDLENLSEITQKDEAAGTAPVISRIGNSFTVKGKATGNIVGMVVLKKDADFEDYEDSHILTHKTVYAPEDTEGVWDFSFDYTFNNALPVGDYKIGFFCDNGDPAISEKVDTVSKIDVDAVVAAFENVTEDNFEELLEANEAFFGDAAGSIKGSATMAESFVLAKAAVEQGLFDQTISEWGVAALTATAMSAIVVDKTMNSSDFAEEIAPYLGSMPDVFGKEYDAEEFEKIFPAVLEEDGAESAEELVNAYKKANVLSVIADGSTKEVEKAIKENSELLGISDSTMKKVTALQLAKKLDTKLETVVESYTGGMETIAEEIAEEINASSGSGGKVLGSGSGSGGGGGFVASVPPTLPEVNKQEEAVAGGTAIATGTYTDITGYDWATDAIMTLSERGIISGKGNGKFDPSGKLTREEAVKLLVTATGTPTDESYNGYDDCVIGSWYYPYITAAKINNLVTGFTRTQFGLGSAVTRQDMAVMLYRAMQKQSLVKAVDAASFTDEAQIADYAKEAVAILGGMGIITGFEDGRFAPNANATRAEAAVIFARYLEISENTAEEGAK